MDDRLLAIQALLKQGNVEEATSELERFEPRSLSDQRCAVQLFQKLGRPSWAEIIVDRYAQLCPSDREGVLDRIEIIAKLNVPARREELEGLLRAFDPVSVDELMRVGPIWLQLNRVTIASALYARVVSLQPRNLSARKRLVETLCWSRQTKLAKKQLRSLRAIIPDELSWWAFLAEFAAFAGDFQLAREATKIAEPRLGSRDVILAIMVAKAYAKSRDFAGVARVLQLLEIEKITTGWILTALHQLAGHTSSVRLQSVIAKQIVSVGYGDRKLIEECEEIALIASSLGIVT